MSTLREAAAAAIPFLESIWNPDEDCGDPGCYECMIERQREKVLSALRAALAEPEAKRLTVGELMSMPLAEPPPSMVYPENTLRKPLTYDEILKMIKPLYADETAAQMAFGMDIEVVRLTERAHGIVDDTPSEAQAFGTDLWSGVK